MKKYYACEVIIGIILLVSVVLSGIFDWIGWLSLSLPIIEKIGGIIKLCGIIIGLGILVSYYKIINSINQRRMTTLQKEEYKKLEGSYNELRKG